MIESMNSSWQENPRSVTDAKLVKTQLAAVREQVGQVAPYLLLETLAALYHWPQTAGRPIVRDGKIAGEFGVELPPGSTTFEFVSDGKALCHHRLTLVSQRIALDSNSARVVDFWETEFDGDLGVFCVVRNA